MLSSGEGVPAASAPSDDAPGAHHVPTARPVDKKKRMSSTRTIHAEAIEVIAEPDEKELAKKKKMWETHSDTGSETDVDSDNEHNVAESNSKMKRRLCLILVGALLFAAFVSGTFANHSVEEEETEKSLQGLASTNYSCSANQTVDFESADVILSLDGMDREATESEIAQVQNSISSVYNEVSDGCDDIYQRIMANATVIEQALIQDSKGAKHLTMGIKTTLACDGCAAEDEILFGGEDELPVADPKGARKLRPGIRGSTNEGFEAIVPAGFKRRALQGVPKGSKKSVNSQKFIDELDATLQASGMPLKSVKEGFVYKQKDGKKKTDKVKMVPKKKDKEDKKHKESTEEAYKGHLEQGQRL